MFAMAKSKTERPSAAKPAETPKGEQTPAERQPKAPKATETAETAETVQTVEEIGGRDGPDPTRYGDYEKDGRCVDF
jgi:hypothetical protein